MSKGRRWSRVVRSVIPAIVIALFVIGISAAAAADNSATQVTAATVNVEICDDCFKPTSVTVNVGDTIVWTHTGNNPHDVTSDNGAFTSPRRMAKGQTFSWTATAAGTFGYTCTVHRGQNGTIIVQAAPAAAPVQGAPNAVPRTGNGGLSAAIQPWQQLAAVGALVVLGAMSLIGRRLRQVA